MDSIDQMATEIASHHHSSRQMKSGYHGSLQMVPTSPAAVSQPPQHHVCHKPRMSHNHRGVAGAVSHHKSSGGQGLPMTGMVIFSSCFYERIQGPSLLGQLGVKIISILVVISGGFLCQEVMVAECECTQSWTRSDFPPPTVPALLQQHPIAAAAKPTPAVMKPLTTRGPSNHSQRPQG